MLALQTLGTGQNGPSLDAALDHLLANRWPPAAWQPVHDAEELPWRFGQLARGLPDGTWRAFTDGARHALAVGSFMPGSRTGRPQLMVRFFDSSARCCGAGIWAQQASGSWSLREGRD